MKTNELMLYIHIPFCVRKCKYCDFLSFEMSSESHSAYVEALIKEIKLRAGFYREYVVSSIFIGGGTPSILEEMQIAKIIDAVKNAFTLSENIEFTIECNPGTLTKSKLDVYKQCGINRISLGLQSANDNELAFIGRIHKYSDFYDSFIMAREAGFDNISVDLISALPNQSISGFEDTLHKVIKLNPEHISVYGLIIEEGTPFYEMDLELPSEDEEREMYYRTKEILSGNGYNQYEISNYAKDGYESGHNKGYWERKNYLGLGLGASSMINNFEENEYSYRWKNTDNFSEYVDNKFKRYEFETLNKADAMSETIFLGLRENKGVSVNEFMNEYGQDIFTVYGSWTNKMINENLIEHKNNFIRLSDKGRDLANYVMSGYV